MLQLKVKQKLAVDAVNDPDIDTLVLFGTVGTGKTDVAAHIVISIAHKFPKTYWPVIRQNLTTAKKSVIPSYLAMLDKMDFVEGTDYTYNRSECFITFPNGSVIPFIEADITKDREGRKIKGINATGNHIDEVDELPHEMYIQANSRKGRRNENGQPSLSIATLNPSDAEHLVKIYDMYKAGTLPKNICCIEFSIEDSWQSQNDIDALMTNPTWWVERYMKNNWKYQDESKTLFKSSLFARAKVDRYDSVMKTSGYDVARDGTDRSVNADWDNFTLYDIQVVKDSKDQMETDDQAKWLIEHSDINGIGYENIAIDGVGVGVGVLDSGKLLGAHFDVYKSGFSPDMYLTFEDNAPTKFEAEKASEVLSFNNLRSQMAYMFARGMERGTIKILESCPFYNELIKEAQQHYFEVKDKVLILESKESIKKRTGKSPDIFDAVVMGLYKQMKKSKKTEFSFV